MTRDRAGMTDQGHGHGHANLEAEILAALWEEVPFPRLPFDAPAELKELVVEIENPKRVYTIHRATRRHNLQLLVEKFVSQLRYGCGYNDCPTPSCFSCRRRLVGNSPIRRYSPTSARTLAVYLASQDNPELHLCPNLQTPRGPSDAIKPLIFAPKHHSLKSDLGDVRSFKHSNGHVRAGSVKDRETTKNSPRPTTPPAVSNVYQRDVGQNHATDLAQLDGGLNNALSSLYHAPKVSISEQPIRKDYRSFAANVFGTVAFKMVEWLSPNNLDAITSKALGGSNQASSSNTASGTSAEAASASLLVSPGSGSARQSNYSYDPNITGSQESTSEPTPINPQEDGVVDSHARRNSDWASSSVGGNGNTNGPTRPGQPRKNSSARVRTPSTAKTQPKVHTNHFANGRRGDAPSVPISPRSPVSQADKTTKGFVRPTSTISRQLSSEQLHDALPEDDHPEPQELNRRISLSKTHVDGDKLEESLSTGDTIMSTETTNDSSDHFIEHQNLCTISDIDDLLPQSLSRLNTQAIDFICDVLQDDHTTEAHLLEPSTVPAFRKSLAKSKPLRRRRPHHPYPHNLKLEWKLFVEQSIFNVLSDPHAILNSFTNQDGLIDSQTLWYYMLRLTRVAPSLVFDSLWNVSASLFAPPKALKSARSPTTKAFSNKAISLTNEEAGFLLSVCFHALVAAAPLVTDSTQLFDMSRIRSRGLILAESGAVARQPSSLCLQYEDAFSDHMALRLARRLLAAISTRKYFDELIALDVDSEDGTPEPDMLATLLSHLEPGREIQPSLGFSCTERDMHEKRVPVLLLDWARTVMFNEWDAKPEVSGTGPFGGALSLMAAMYQKRNSLLLGDVAFRTEYFGDRLDAIEVPVSWLTFNSTRQKVHLLDYPYIFHPSSLVTYFRAVNFSRMSRSYEESSSLQSRIKAIVAPDCSLVADQHQKTVLQDLLKVPSAKFLILDIGRKTVIRDVFDQLWRRQERELIRPLKVHLGEDTGEEGFDSGGVQQEFFRLAIAEALNPDYGAFTVDERTRMTWFQPGSLQPEWKFELIGVLMSLAVYNGLTLPITFPKALYRKLLGEPVTELHHIADGWPDLANGLTTLIEWDEKDGAVEDIFARTYEFSIDMFGQPISREMGPSQHLSWPQFSHHSSEPLASLNPEDAPLVTHDNRNAYVSDYIRYLTDISVAPQFEAFHRGFRACLNAKSLQLLTSPLLQSIVEGTQEIDIAELRRATRYVGWDATHRTVRDFWSIVKRYDDRMKRKLLEFVTASDRVPVGGMRNVQFVVQKNGEEEGEDGHLPTAYTCYGTLLLPEYRDKEVLRERMGMALENAQGFGFA